MSVKTMKILFEYVCWDAEINWSRPVLYTNAKDSWYEYDRYYFYKITGKYSKYPPRLFYIGKTFSQSVKTRLNQKDHINRYKTIRKNYPRFEFYVNFGSIKLAYGKLTQKRIDEIESLLIYSDDSEYLQNKTKIMSLNVKEQYIIKNKGYSAPLHREIAYGMFFR